MKFPLSVLDSDSYLQTINDLLDDHECLIFIDTNILAQLYKIYASARTEFFGWADPLITAGRLKIPVWALNEYSNHFINGRTEEYFALMGKVGSAQNDFEEAKNFLTMNMDEESLRASPYTDLHQFTTDLDLVSEKLKQIKLVAKNKKLAYILQVHEQIQSKFDEAVIDSNIFELVENMEGKTAGRFHSKLPPGFMDTKDFNSNGDLIIWNEILNYAKSNNTKKVIILTNDNKKDWMYAPKRIKAGNHTGANEKPVLKIADTRLVYEFKLATGSEELYIINFETLSKELVKRDDNRYLALARALQLVTEQVIADAENQHQENQTKSELVEPATEIPVAPQEITQTVVEVEAEEFPYSQSALGDSYFKPDRETIAGNIINQLMTHDWYRQNDGINELKSASSNGIITQATKDHWFVLGRNVYQAACGGAFQAIEYMETLDSQIQRLPSELQTAMLSGIYYEVYFNGRGEFRRGDFKTGQLESAFAVQTFPFALRAIEFINQALEPFENYLIIYPSANPQTVNFQVSTNLEDDEYILGKFNKIEAIDYNGTSLLKPVAPNRRHGGYYFDDVKQLKIHIRNELAIPTNQFELVFQTDVNQVPQFHLIAATVISKADLPIPEVADSNF